MVRFESERSGELLHRDAKCLARFKRVGHRITGGRRGASDGAGWEMVHVAVDDASRLACVEVLPDEKQATTTGFLVRALRWFRARGTRLERVLSDSDAGYISQPFRKGLPDPRPAVRPHQALHAGHEQHGGGQGSALTIRTMPREWAHAISFRNANSHRGRPAAVAGVVSPLEAPRRPRG